jgi:TonB family protein
MKILTLLFLATLLFVNRHNSSQNAELQEASTLNESAVKLFNQKKYDEAIPLAKRALAIRDKLLPRNDAQIASSLNNLGELYLAMKDYKAAREVFDRLLKIQEEIFGADDVNLTFTLDRLAVLHYAAGNWSETEAAYKRVLVLREKGLGTNDVLVAQSWFSLGEFYRFRRKLEPALDSYKRSLELYGKLGKTMTPEFERASDGFACLGYDHHKPELFKQLTDLRRQFAGPTAAEESEGVVVLNGKALSMPRPEYPVTAVVRRLTGMVVVKVEVDEAGNVVAARDMCLGPPYFSEAAVAAARKARFTPTTINGQPVRVRGVIQYNFQRRFR